MKCGDREPIPHGGDLDAAAVRFPNAQRPWIDLSTGINPVPYPVPTFAAHAWARLPTKSDEHALQSAAAASYGADDPESIVLAPGTQALIQLIPRLLSPTRVAVIGPAYEEHQACWRRQGHTIRVVDSLDDRADPRVIVVVNPNNPTGTLIPANELRAAANALLANDGLLVVDEAFMDVLPREASLASDLPPATVVLRSFGKTYGLAGLRLGFAIAAPTLAGRLRAELGPWAVSGPALALGTTALRDATWLEHAKARLIRDRDRLDLMLEAAGFAILGGTPLFRLADHPKAPAIADHLGARGLHVRRFAPTPSWLRFGVPGPPGDWERLAAALGVS